MTVSKTLSSFVEACLDPLPTDALIDIEYNSLLRRARLEAWRKANAVTEYRKARLRLFDAKSEYARRILNIEQGKRGGRRRKFVAAYRSAIAAQILVPAPTKSAMLWKRKAGKLRRLPITKDQVAAAIAEDKAFLAAHPTSRKKAAKA